MATVAQVWQQHELIGNLVGREIRARYKQSVLGVAWSILTPLINTFLSTFLFSIVAGLHADKTASGHVPPYPLFVYAGTMFWGLFAACIASGTDSLTGNIQLLTKVYFPREVFTLAAIAGRAVDFAFSLVPLVVLVVFYGVTQHTGLAWTTVFVPLVLLIQLVLTLGLSFLLATLNLFYRDVRFVIGLVIQIWMYLTPIMYPLSKVLSQAHRHPLLVFLYMHLNPMTPLMLAYQHLMLNIPLPPGVNLGPMLASSALVSVALLLAGYGVFAKYEGQFAEAV